MDNISDEYLLNLIGKYGEGIALDYKEESYLVSVEKKDKRDRSKVEKAKKKKRDLIVDLVALANSNGGSLALIITGVKEDKTQVLFEKVGIQKGICSDHVYQNLIREAVTPTIQFTYHEVTDNNGYSFGFFILQDNVYRPYVLRKNDPFGNFNEGTIPVRNGSSNQILNNVGSVVTRWKQEDTEFRKNLIITKNVCLQENSELSDPDSEYFSNSIIDFMASLKKKVEKLTADQFQVLHHLRYKSRVVITGCAGSGKTLLVAEKAIRLDQSGIKTLVLCHNPMLARYIRHLISNPSIDVYDITAFIANSAEKQFHINTDWNEFVEPLEDDIERAFDNLDGCSDIYEAVLVDEGQDFRELWWIYIEALLEFSKNKILYIFCDDNQALLPYRSKYPIEESPISMSKNCRNGGNIFEVVKKFHKRSPLVSQFLHSDGLVRLSVYNESNYKAIIENVLIDAYDHADHNQICVITNESSATDSILNNYEFIKFGEKNWRIIINNDLISIRNKVIKKINKLRSGSSHSEIANRFGIPLNTDIEEYLKVPSFSNENLPTDQDIQAVRAFASKLLPFFGGTIVFGGVRFKIDAKRLFLVGKTHTGKDTSVNTSSKLSFYAASNWAESLYSIKPTKIVSKSTAQISTEDILPLYTIDMFKGLESDAIILFINTINKELLTQMYVGSSRAIGYLHIVISRSILARIDQLDEVSMLNYALQ